MSLLKSYTKKLEELKKQIAASEKGGNADSDKVWKPSLIGNKETNYTLRFLPRVSTETGLSWVTYWMHYVDLPGGKRKLIEMCPITIKKKCPICEDVSRLFNSGNPYDEKKGKERFRKSAYAANIFVVDDPRDKGANIGKVMIWKYGWKLHGTFKAAIDKLGLVFFDPFAGANLLLSLKPQGDWADYSGSMFAPPSPLASSEEEMEKILSKCYDLEKEFFSESNFKPYDELKAGYEEAVKVTVGASTPSKKKAAPKEEVEEKVEEEAEPEKESEEPEEETKEDERDPWDKDKDEKAETKEPEVEGFDQDELARLQKEIENMKLDSPK